MPISDYLKNLREKIGHELVLAPAAAAVVRNAAGEILLLRRSDNSEWTIPGGMLDPTELPAQAAVHEVYEETGFIVKPMRMLGVVGGLDHRITYPNQDVGEFTVTVFECQIVAGEARALDGEALELGFFSSHQLPESWMLGRFPKAFFQVSYQGLTLVGMMFGSSS